MRPAGGARRVSAVGAGGVTGSDVVAGESGRAFVSASPVDGVRQGAKARELAAAACKLSNMKDADALAALAAAEAELGKYDEAA